MKKAILLLLGLAFLLSKNEAQTITDYDGNVYDTVMIGSQAWMKQNLRATHYNNGVPIPLVADTLWSTNVSGARCYYNNDETANKSLYGALYNFHAVTDVNGLCPTGWHVSTDAEWLTAELYLGGQSVAGGKMKEVGTANWLTPNTGATNSTDFTGLPGGMINPSGVFATLNENGLFWTNSFLTISTAWSTYLWYMSAGVDHNPTPKNYGLSVRCVKGTLSGTGDISAMEEISLYPNPATDRVTLTIPENKEMKINIYNIIGECVMQGTMNKLSNEISVSGLSKGIYIIRISDAENTIQKKLIKE